MFAFSSRLQNKHLQYWPEYKVDNILETNYNFADIYIYIYIYIYIFIWGVFIITETTTTMNKCTFQEEGKKREQKKKTTRCQPRSPSSLYSSKYTNRQNLLKKIQQKQPELAGLSTN
uniref:Uncharacterized protein n=1 Tax=Octopus bimaculoides TaxID=37653 RepID=A0A0L8GDM0_OCTBM